LAWCISFEFFNSSTLVSTYGRFFKANRAPGSALSLRRLVD
jgi:hypothetical protein